jgi:phosphoglycerol transferase
MTRAFKNIGAFIFLTFLTKFMIGYLIAGKAGLTIMGTDYSAIAGSAISTFQHYLELLKLAIQNIDGHILAICLLFSVPIATAVNHSFALISSKEEIRTDQKISFFSLVVLINLILVTGIFAAMTINAGPYENIGRLSMRYYDFTFPLLLIIAASQLPLETMVSKFKWRIITAIPIGVALLYAIYTHMATYMPNFVDCPELRGFTYNSTVFYVLGGISFLSLVLWVYKTRIGIKIFIYIFIPLTIIFSTLFVSHELRQSLIPDVFDKAGIFTRQYLPDSELSKVLVVGSEPGGLFKSLFYLDNPGVSFETIPKDSIYDISELPKGKEYILAIGDHLLPENMFFQIPMNGFILARATSTNTVDFKMSTWPGIISSTHGLSSAEAWGTWSTSDAVTLEFSTPLPEKFALHLVASAFGPNVGKDFVAHVGDDAIKFKLTSLPLETVLEFSNPQKSRTIEIDIPSSISPKELGLSGDERNLGIGLTRLTVTSL